MTASRELATIHGSTPRSTRRITVSTASEVCSVVSTRWPVRLACKAICAVSGSRISPTRMTSGSCRRMARRPEAKVKPWRTLVCPWVISGNSTSMGSSSVTTLRSAVFINWSIE